MKTKTEYYLITDQTGYGLIHRVNEHLKHGWTLQGGISIARGPGNYVDYAQALSRTPSSEDKLDAKKGKK